LFFDVLGFDQHFLSVLSLIGSVLTLFGMFLFRRFMAERSIAYVVGFQETPPTARSTVAAEQRQESIAT